MIKAIIFDLDGTLLNTLPSIAHYGNEALKKYGFPTIEVENYKYMVGEGAPLLVHRMLEAVGAPESAFEEVYGEYRRTYDADASYKTSFYDGILELLGTLSHRGIRKAVCSNKPQEQVDGVLAAFFPENMFEVILGSREGLPKKPDPTGVFLICDKMGLKPEECLYVGDTATDMKTGKAAGCRTIGVSWGFRTIEELLQNGAYAVAEEPMELTQCLF